MADDAKDMPEWLLQARNQWTWRGRERPTFAETPAPGQQSVWDYPRPPAIAPDPRQVEVGDGEVTIARSTAALKVMETASPPTWYLPLGDIDMSALAERGRGSFCEWKGEASYYAVRIGGEWRERIAWRYANPLPGFEEIENYVAFYPGALVCRVDGVRVVPQPGGMYGGWITPELTGPFKGGPGTGGW